VVNVVGDFMFARFYALNDLFTYFLGWDVVFHMYGKTSQGRHCHFFGKYFYGDG